MVGLILIWLPQSLPRHLNCSGAFPQPPYLYEHTPDLHYSLLSRPLSINVIIQRNRRGSLLLRPSCRIKSQAAEKPIKDWRRIRLIRLLSHKSSTSEKTPVAESEGMDLRAKTAHASEQCGLFAVALVSLDDAQTYRMIMENGRSS